MLLKPNMCFVHYFLKLWPKQSLNRCVTIAFDIGTRFSRLGEEARQDLTLAWVRYPQPKGQNN